jgi:hypothetical protein
MKMSKKIKTYNPSFALNKRLKITNAFVKKHLPAGSSILDLGPPNIMSEQLRSEGFDVSNAVSPDLDLDFGCVQTLKTDAFTSFEVFEHLVNPFPLLRSIKAPVLIASVPLRLWFSKAFREPSVEDPFDYHYHEFEPWQFRLLLEKAGWNIEDEIMWTSHKKIPLGFRPLLRTVFPRYMLVKASRNQGGVK